HYSSGIYNKVFCLVAQSSGWTTRMAFDIFTKANTDYWTASETFASGAEDVKQAALDYGYNCQDVVDAFAVVGITISCPGPAVDIYVSNIAQTITKVAKRYKSTAVVTIKDINNALVSNATVYVTWSGAVTGSTSGVTGTNGTVTFVSSQVRVTGPFTITVTNVTHPSNTYNPALNVETSDTASY
ncbi:MAG: vibriolysin, partial [Acidobacteriota bacterium]|nr:vibriolysin [Acidobacteriota bacterium]